MTNKLAPNQWIWISLTGFLLFAAFFYYVIIYSLKGQISTPVYFILIILTALFATGFLSGMLNSAAKYSGTFQNRTLSISGPAVIFFIILYIGYKYKPETAGDVPLSLSVIIKSGRLLSNGTVSVRIGQYSAVKNVNDQGEALFTGINPAYRGLQMDLDVLAPGYEFSRSGSYKLSDSANYTNLTVEMRPQKKETYVQGRVIHIADRTGIAGALVQFQGYDRPVRTDSLGNFTASLPVAPGAEIRVLVIQNNKEIYNSLRTVISDDFLSIPAD